ncbi:MAG TPA: DUF1499 domain-containing protein [Pseudolabrys sp.]
MARRPTFGDEPKSRLAVWSARFAFFALVVAALSVIIVRSGLLEIEPALATFAAALIFAVLAILLSFLAFIVIWRQGLSGIGSAVLALFLSLLLLAYPAYLGYRATKLPAISDITTDASNPPRFDVLARARPPGRSDYRAADARLQSEAYPDIGPLQVSAPVKLAYDVTLSLVTKRKWHIADARPPAGRHEGAIEATARTPIMGFRDDVAIRITPTSEGARIDARSASRVGLYDFGANAARIRSLLEDIDDAVSSAPEPRAEPEKKKQPAPRRPAPKR